jgi:antitoxin component YwqK of YwqJK toxin-antitoxin module
MEFDSCKLNPSVFTCDQYDASGSIRRSTWNYFGKFSETNSIAKKITEWDKNGEVSYFKVMGEKGKILFEENYPFDQLKDIQFCRTFYSDSSLMDQGFYRNGKDGFTKIKYGVWFHFFSNKQLQSVGYYFNDQPYGLHFTYDSTGKTIDSVYYSNGKPDVEYLKNLKFYKIDSYDHKEKGNKTKNGLSEGMIFDKSEYSGQQIANNFFYFYKRESIDVMPYASKDSLKNAHIMSFTFPIPEIPNSGASYFLSLYKNHHLRMAVVTMEHHWINSSCYSEDGACLSAHDASGRQKWYFESGKLHYQTHPEFYPQFNIHGVQFTGVSRDTAIYYSQSGNDSMKLVFGYWGMVSDTLIKTSDGSWIDKKNTKRKNLLIEIKPGIWFESIDYRIELPGYWKEKTQSGIVYAEGNFNDYQNGQWTERSEKTGKIICMESFEKGVGMGKGLYVRYYENGKLAESGYYAEGRKRDGVWKEYNEKGKLMSVSKYKNTQPDGMWRCKTCCKNKNGKHRRQITIYKNGKQVFVLHKNCGVEIYD